MVYYNRLQWTLWIKKSLGEWLKTGTGSSYCPFDEHFRMWFEPHEVLVSLYNSLVRTQRDLFNEALADVLLNVDPAAHAPLFRELIQLMEAIKSEITFEVLTEMMESDKIPESTSSPNFEGTYYLLEEATEIVERFHTN